MRNVSIETGKLRGPNVTEVVVRDLEAWVTFEGFEGLERNANEEFRTVEWREVGTDTPV